MKPTKKVALIHDLCGVGKAALTNMLPILAASGIEACPIPTVLLSTHTGGYGQPATMQVPASYIRACADHYVREHISFDMIFVGYLGNEETAKAVCYFLEQFPDIPVLLDPIMGDHGCYYRNFDASYAAAVRKVLPYADYILPNLTECFLLLDQPYREISTSEEIETICKQLKTLHAEHVIITSVSVINRDVNTNINADINADINTSENSKKRTRGQETRGIAVYKDQKLTYLPIFEDLPDFHGSGDVFDGVIITRLLNQEDILTAVSAAHQFVCACLTESSQYDYPEREGLLIEKVLKHLYK